MGVACDIRVCTKDARMCVKEVDIGIAADIGTLTRLPKMGISYSWVKEVCLTAREFGSEEALRVGFVSNVYEDKAQGMEGALAICKLIAEKSPVAVFGTKEILNFSRDRSIEDGELNVRIFARSKKTDVCFKASDIPPSGTRAWCSLTM